MHFFGIKLSLFAIITIVNINKIVSAESSSKMNHLNMAELNGFNYQIDISDELRPKQENTVHHHHLTEASFAISLKSSNGQSYECRLPEVFSEFDEESENNIENININDLANINKYNFTLINQKIVQSMQNLKNSNICLFRVISS
jgi:hypothetical protein